ncbi:MAG: hypothetical protein JNK16_06345 [Phycisphaerales bacterium]|nr:hypothetical protein [Phycisphaerales bacterium]
MSLLESVVIVQFAATSYLVGVIWVIQIVHYPMFNQLDPACASDACRRHATRITPVVGIPMLLEAAAAAALAWPGLFHIPDHARIVSWAGLALLAGIWLSTFALQVPQHDQLAKQSGAIDSATVARLVSTNWIRTVLWTLRLPIVSYTLFSIMHPSPV